MDDKEKIQETFSQLEQLKYQVLRLVSDAESEKDSRKRSTDHIIDMIRNVETDFKDVLYGKDRMSGIVVELDRLKQESNNRKAIKQNIVALWIAAGSLFAKIIYDALNK